MEKQIYNSEAEKALIGCIFSDPSILEMINLDKEDFYLEPYRIIYGCMKYLKGKGITPDLLTVDSELKKAKRIDKVGGSYVLAEAHDSVISVGHFESYVVLIKEASNRRKLAESLGSIEKMIEGECSSADLQIALTELAKNISPVGKKPEGDINSSNMEGEIDALLATRTDYTWGTPALDRDFSPLSTSKYVILAGETGVGKTTFALHFAIENAKLNHKVLYLSLEMTNQALLIRYARARLGITKTKWKAKDYSKEEIKKIISDLPSNLVFKEIKLDGESVDLEWISEVITNGDYDMVFIDNFGFIESQGKDENDKFKTISRRIVEIVKRKPVIIVALHHFRKGGERESKIRNINALMGTAKLAHDIDFCVQVLRDMSLDKDSSDADRSELSVALQKDRDWGEFVCNPVFFKKGKFYDIF